MGKKSRQNILHPDYYKNNKEMIDAFIEEDKRFTEAMGEPFRSPLDFFTGSPEKRENVSLLRPEQEPLYQQSIKAALGRGAGGAFGDAADYYRNNLSDNPQDYESFANPAIRQFNEQTIPDLAEQFAGMGAGGLSSSGFRNASIGAGTDLAERLGQIRANLRQSSAQGLQNIGQAGLQNYSQNMITEHGTPGLLPTLASAAGTAIGAYFGGPAGAAAGGAIGNTAGNSFGSPGNYSTPPQGQGYDWANLPGNMQGGNTNSGWFKGSGNRVGAKSSPYGNSSMTAQGYGWSNIPASPQMRGI